VPSIGIGGLVLVQAAKCASFTLAGHAFHDVPIQFSTQSGGVSGVARAAGMIGAVLLCRFVVTFDLPHGRILFEPADSVDAPFDRDRLGVGLYVREDRAIVDFVIAGSPAAAAGLATGMQLVEIDGMQLDGGELRDRLRRLRLSPAGTLIRLGASNGRRFLVELADFD
jgi:membrane-associated protease RseP (regulator of RpoE activity)